MASNNWIGPKTGTSNFWQNAANWSGGVPTNASDVVMAGGTYTVVITAAEHPYQIKSLTMGGTTGTVRLVDGGSLSVIGGATLAHSIFDVGAGGTASIFGSLTLGTGSTAMTEGVLNVAGTVAGNAGTVTIDGGGMFAGAIGGTDRFALSLDGTLEIGRGIAATTAISFADTGADALLLDNAGATLAAAVTGFGGDNRIDIGSLAFSSQYTENYSGTTLTISGAAGAVFTIANIDNPGAFTLADDGSGGTLLTVCYVRGTMIETPTGEVAVEALNPGDLVATLAGDARVPAAVTWVGRRRLDLAAHPEKRLVAPVVIERGAFAEDMPRRDLLLSPDHAVLADGRLICVRQLVNGTTIRQDMSRQSIEYYHVELGAHAILLAEGLAAESYLDTGNRGFFAAPDRIGRLLTDPAGRADERTRAEVSCAPFATDEATIHPVWQRLADRAASLGRRAAPPPVTEDPDLRLLVGDRLIRAVSAVGHVFTFPVPPGAGVVRLVSRAAAPSDTRPWLDDRRRLGVRVARLVMRGRDELHDIPLDHPCLAAGWWEVERDGVAFGRWTDGNAVVPLPASLGASILEVRVVGTIAYPTPAEIPLAA